MFPTYRTIVTEYAKQFYKMQSEGRFEKKITWNTVYHKTYISKHSDQSYVRVEEYSCPLAFDENSNLISHLNYGFVFRDITQPLVIRPKAIHPISGYFKKEERALQLKTIPIILEKLKNENRNKKPMLSKSEFRIAKLYFNGCKTAAEVAEVISTSLNNVKQHNKSIIRKIAYLFPREFKFKDAREVSIFLGNLGFLYFEEHFLQQK